MNITVIGRHMDVTDAMRAHAEEKVGKLPRLYDALLSADVTFGSDAGEYAVEIVATGKRKSVFVARQHGPDMYACLDQCLHKLQQQLRRHKDRVRDRQGPGHQQTMLPEAPGQ